MLDADGNPLQWDHGLRNIEKEKASSLAILGKLVPQAEIFLKTTQKSHIATSTVQAGMSESQAIKKNIQIKRFDPSNPESYTLVVSYLLFVKPLTNIPLDSLKSAARAQVKDGP